MITKYNPHIIVVGAGIAGASLAYHLTMQKAHVTLIDRANQPAQEVTEKSFAWITAGHDTSEINFNFKQQAIADWRRLEDELRGALKINWSGALSWYSDMTEADQIANKLNSLDYKVRLIDSQQIKRLEPNLKIVPDQAFFAENEGAIDPALTTQLLIKAACEAGAILKLNTEVLFLMTSSSRVTGVVTIKGNLNADMVVLTAGTDTAVLCKPLGLNLPVKVSPAILMKFYTQQQFVNRIVSNPFMEIRAASDHLMLAAEDYIDESADNNPQAIAGRTLEAIKKHWRGATQVKLIDVVVGKRPVPQDGQLIIGQAPDIKGLYLTVVHPGITFAALAGKLAADEIITGQNNILQSTYRPDRFN
ncbi:MAG: FAD-binding oxidoreductase [Sphingobacteriaceae bacterium]|nr:MAG: FAD-binding oxidoreductase [Sphingobacteriaceae bacterium]